MARPLQFIPPSPLLRKEPFFQLPLYVNNAAQYLSPVHLLVPGELPELHPVLPVLLLPVPPPIFLFPRTVDRLL